MFLANLEEMDHLVKRVLKVKWDTQDYLDSVVSLVTQVLQVLMGQRVIVVSLVLLGYQDEMADQVLQVKKVCWDLLEREGSQASQVFVAQRALRVMLGSQVLQVCPVFQEPREKGEYLVCKVLLERKVIKVPKDSMDYQELLADLDCRDQRGRGDSQALKVALEFLD